MDQSTAVSSPPDPEFQAVAGTRRYRSKAQRPCDLCRARKVLCNIPDPSRPCQLCRRTGRQCTFVGNPGRRKGKKVVSGHVGSRSPSDPAFTVAPQEADFSQAITTDTSPPGSSSLRQQGQDRAHGSHINIINGSSGVEGCGQDDPNLPLEAEFSDFMWPMQQENDANWTFSDDELINRSLENQESPSTFNFTPMDNENMPSPQVPPAPQARNAGETHPTHHSELLSIDVKVGMSPTFIGYSNESDPFALDHFPYGPQDELGFFRVSYRKVYSEALPPESSHPLHFLHSQSATAAESKRIVDECLLDIDDRSHLEKLVDKTNGVALVKLYFRFIFPSLPILSRSLVLRDIEAFVTEAPTGLLAGIYALSLPFAPWDESLCLHNAYSPPSIDALWKITNTSLQRELQFPRLSTVQTFLLLLNYLPFDSVSVENPFAWSMAAAMLAMTQSLGLGADPRGWKIPSWEIRLRRRLWWAVVVEHTWRSITHGRSSMLRDDDWDVSPLDAEDFMIDPTTKLPGNGFNPSPDYFIRLSSLTLIADEICRKFFTLRAVSRHQSLESLIPQARELRQRLINWLELLPESLQLNFKRTDESSEDSVESHAPLYVAYYTAHILIFRALLRPIISKADGKDKANDDLQATVVSVLQASRSLVRTVIKFICSFDARQQSAFWPTYTRHCLSYPGLFCYMLSLQRTQPDMKEHDRNLLATWRKTLRTRLQSWPLLRFAIVKVDAIYWKGVQGAAS